MYSDDCIIDEMIANQTEGGFDKELKTYIFGCNLIIGPAVTFWPKDSKNKTLAKAQIEPKKWWMFWK
jgi:hypothetical protein